MIVNLALRLTIEHVAGHQLTPAEVLDRLPTALDVKLPQYLRVEESDGDVWGSYQITDSVVTAVVS